MPRANNINFRGAQFYTQQENDVVVREKIREHIENNFNATYHFPNQFDRKSIEQLKGEFKFYSSTNAGEKADETGSNPETKVDELKLRKKLNWGYLNRKRKDELYSGPALSKINGGCAILKNGGFNSILALESDNDSNYGKIARSEGLKFVGLENIGNGTLHVFCIIHTQHKPEVLMSLIEHPEEWATMNPDGTKKETVDKAVSDIQDFIDIMDGKNEDYPLPLYFGCDLGSNRTYYWNLFYNILKNEDRTKPLSEEVIQKLQEFDKDTEDCYRY